MGAGMKGEETNIPRSSTSRCQPLTRASAAPTAAGSNRPS
jgi:hypothetical protein